MQTMAEPGTLTGIITATGQHRYCVLLVFFSSPFERSGNGTTGLGDWLLITQKFEFLLVRLPGFSIYITPCGNKEELCLEAQEVGCPSQGLGRKGGVREVIHH